MNCNDGERILPATGLPVAQASDLNSGRDLNQAVFGLRQMNFASRQETGDGLHMATTQPSARLEKITRPPGLRRIQTGIALVRICLQTAHTPILAEAGSIARIDWAGFMRFSAHVYNQSRESFMPIYEYICKECQHEFEALVYGKEKAECPKCHASKLEPQLSVFAVSAKGSTSSAPSTGACGSCGDPRGPGACSMRDMN